MVGVQSSLPAVEVAVSDSVCCLLPCPMVGVQSSLPAVEVAVSDSVCWLLPSDGWCTVIIASDGSAAHLPVLWEFLCPIVGVAINTGCWSCRVR